MTKDEAVHDFVKRDFAGLPQDWVKIVAEAKDADIYAWPMWGTMWIVDGWLGEKLMTNAVQVCEPSACENHDKNKTCDICEDYEEMGGAHNVKDKDGRGMAAYIYEIDGVFVLGIHGAGWNFYDGVWDRLYDLLGLQWHDEGMKEPSLAELEKL